MHSERLNSELPTELPNFETLRYLAEHEPERLEALRSSLTEQLIASAAPRLQRRLRGLQFEIDARVRMAPNPIAACVTVTAMMRGSLEQLQRTLNGELPAPDEKSPADVIPFPTRH